MKNIETKIFTQATAELQEEVEKELGITDPEQTEALERLRENIKE